MINYWLFVLSWFLIYYVGFNRSILSSFALASATGYIFVFIINMCNF